MATHVYDRLSQKLLVVTISAIAQNEWTDVLDTEGATSVFITCNGSDVTMFLPSFNTGTGLFETDGTNARNLENLIATATVGQLKMATGSTYAGYIPGNVIPPRLQFRNTNASARNMVAYISY